MDALLAQTAATFAGVVVAVVLPLLVLRKQVTDHQRSQKVAILLTRHADFQAPAMLRLRARAARELSTGGTALPPQGQMAVTLLVDLFELLASLRDHQVVDRGLVATNFGHAILHYWEACRPLVEAARRDLGNDELWREFEELRDEVLAELSTRPPRGTRRPASLVPGPADVQRFLANEVALEGLAMAT